MAPASPTASPAGSAALRCCSAAVPLRPLLHERAGETPLLTALAPASIQWDRQGHDRSSTRVGRPASALPASPLHQLGQGPWVRTRPASPLFLLGQQDLAQYCFFLLLCFSLLSSKDRFAEKTFNFMHLISHKPCIGLKQT